MLHRIIVIFVLLLFVVVLVRDGIVSLGVGPTIKIIFRGQHSTDSRHRPRRYQIARVAPIFSIGIRRPHHHLVFLLAIAIASVVVIAITIRS